MPPPRALKLGVNALFVGLLSFAWWMDHRFTGTGVVAAEPGTDARSQVGFRLQEVSAASGVRFEHHQTHLDPQIANVEPHVAAMGAAVSVADVNADGWPDFYATSSEFGTPNALFLNQGDGTAETAGTFRDVAGAAGVADLNRDGEGASMGSIWGDCDNDGFEDLFVYKWGYAQLFHNDGDLTFTDVTAAAGLRRWMNSNAAAWLDYDRDGRLDLYVAGYFPEAFDLWHLTTTTIMQDSFEFATNGGHNVLWHNVGGGRFEDVTARMGADSTRWTLAIGAADFDGDGWTDLYLANDYGPEELLRNLGGAGFQAVTDAGLSERSKSGMAVAMGDVRGDGHLGVYVTNISKAGYLFQGNNLRVNRLADTGRFENIADGVVEDCGWSWGAQFGDLNNDGFEDLYVVNGFISASHEKDYWYDMGKVAMGTGRLFQDTVNWPPIDDASLSGYERSRVLMNRAGRGFVDVAEAVGATDLLDGRAVALADLWNRGALDVLVANQKGPLLVYRNDVEPANLWVGFRLVGGASNRSAIGAEVRLACGGREQLRVVTGGSGFCAQNDRRVHFGLGAGGRPDRAVIRWPTGREQVVPSPEPGRYHVVREEG